MVAKTPHKGSLKPTRNPHKDHLRGQTDDDLGHSDDRFLGRKLVCISIVYAFALLIFASLGPTDDEEAQ